MADTVVQVNYPGIRRLSGVEELKDALCARIWLGLLRTGIIAFVFGVIGVYIWFLVALRVNYNILHIDYVIFCIALTSIALSMVASIFESLSKYFEYESVYSSVASALHDLIQFAFAIVLIVECSVAIHKYGAPYPRVGILVYACIGMVFKLIGCITKN